MAQGPRSFINPNYFYADKLRFMESSVLSFLQQLFSTFPSKKDFEGPGYQYSEDEDVTEIKIEGQNTDNLITVDNRPKIVVARGPVQFQQAGINGFVGSQNLSLGSQRHAIIMAGSVGVSVYSREELEADRIAEICASSIESFQPIIRKYGFLEIRTAQIGQRALIKADARPELFVTPVMLRTSVTANWKREVVDPVKLRRVIIEILAKTPQGTITVSTSV